MPHTLEIVHSLKLVRARACCEPVDLLGHLGGGGGHGCRYGLLRLRMDQGMIPAIGCLEYGGALRALHKAVKNRNIVVYSARRSEFTRTI